LFLVVRNKNHHATQTNEMCKMFIVIFNHNVTSMAGHSVGMRRERVPPQKIKTKMLLVWYGTCPLSGGNTCELLCPREMPNNTGDDDDDVVINR